MRATTLPRSAPRRAARPLPPRRRRGARAPTRRVWSIDGVAATVTPGASRSTSDDAGAAGAERDDEQIRGGRVEHLQLLAGEHASAARRLRFERARRRRPSGRSPRGTRACRSSSRRRGAGASAAAAPRCPPRGSRRPRSWSRGAATGTACGPISSSTTTRSTQPSPAPPCASGIVSPRPAELADLLPELAREALGRLHQRAHGLQRAVRVQELPHLWRSSSCSSVKPKFIAASPTENPLGARRP